MLEKNAIIAIVFSLVVFFAGTLIKKRNRRLHIKLFQYKIDAFDAAIFFLLWLFAISIRDSYDISFYRIAFDERIPHGKEPFFDFIQFFFHDHGMSFDTFRIIWSTIVYILLIRGIRHYTDSPRVVLAFSLLTPFTAYFTQMRNAMVAAIMINAFQLLLSDRKKDRFLYILIVLLSAQIHTIAYVYLLLLILKRREIRTYSIKYFIILGVVTVFAIAFSSLSADTVNGLFARLPIPGSITRRLMDYAGSEERTSLKSAISITLKHLFMYILTDRACKMLERNDIWFEQTRKYRVLAEMNVLMLVFIPISIINLSFERIFSCFMMVQYAIIFSVRNEKVGISDKLSITMRMQTVLMLGMIILLFITLKSNPDDLLRLYNSTGL